MKGVASSSIFLLQREPKILGLDEPLFFVGVLFMVGTFLALPPGWIGLLGAAFLTVMLHAVLLRLSRDDARAAFRLAAHVFSQRRFHPRPHEKDLVQWLSSRLFSSV